MNWQDSDELLAQTQQSVAAEATTQAVSEVFTVDDPTCLVVDVVISGLTLTNAINVILQTRSCGGTWINAKSADPTDDGITSITLLETVADDQEFLPLRKQCRVVVTTGVDDVLDIDNVIVTRGVES